MKNELCLFKIKGTPFTIVAESEDDAKFKWNRKDIQLGSNAFYKVDSVEKIEKVPTVFNVDKEIYNDETFSGYASELLEEFCLSLKEPYVRDCDPNNPDDIEGADFMYTTKGMKLVERLISRLHKVGNNAYPDGDLNISSMAYSED